MTSEFQDVGHDVISHKKCCHSCYIRTSFYKILIYHF